MNLITVVNQFPTQESCIDHLENIRFGDSPYCPLCGSDHVARRQGEGRVGRWNCHACKSSFNVLSGTIMQGTKIALQKWFVAIALMLNAKKSVSSPQLARDLDMNQKSAWYMQQRIRAAMASDDQSLMLEGIVEVDETYIGGKPRKPNRREDDKPAKRGRGTDKTPVIGAIERGGNVVAQMALSLTGRDMLGFIKDVTRPENTILVTDEYAGYNGAAAIMPHYRVNHSEAYSQNGIHTNTIEGFWATLKRAWYGSHHHYSKSWMPLYIAEASWKYNRRKSKNLFDLFMRGCFA